MPSFDFVELLGQVPQSGVFISAGKLLGMMFVFTLWTFIASWADKDAIAVNTYRAIWNGVIMAGGVISFLLLLFLPQFLAAVGAYVVLNGIVAVIYVVHRNGLVVEEDKVCTPAHIQRLMREGFRGKKKEDSKRDVKERVRLTAFDRKTVKIPEEDPEREQFALVQELLYDGLWRRATQIELIPAGQTTRIRVVVDGVASEKEPIGRAVGDGMLIYLKRLAGLNLEERRKPQRGKMGAAIGDHKYELVIRTEGSTAGEFLKVRVIGAEKGYKIQDLGFTKQQLEAFREIMNIDNGVVVLSAPPGGGVTTTAYSIARSHDAFLQNIQMLEWEHEYDVDNITQHTYAPADDKPFHQELLKVFRTDPDVVVVPEVRDAQTAIEVSKAGVHKQNVYVAMHANDIFDALGKWIEWVKDPNLLSKSLLAVTHQRLVRALCTACKTPYKPDAAMMQKISAPAGAVLHRVPEVQYDKNGNPVLCQNCQGTGYVGRTAIIAVLAIDDLRNALKAGKPLADLKSIAAKKGGLSLQQIGLQKVFDGVTSIDELARATKAPGAVPPAAATPRAAAPAAGAKPAAPRPAAKPAAPRGPVGKE